MYLWLARVTQNGATRFVAALAHGGYSDVEALITRSLDPPPRVDALTPVNLDVLKELYAADNLSECVLLEVRPPAASGEPPAAAHESSD